ncbi:hypothetical protein [Glycomyces sp. MUSA5-2]|uniref:hypothetical protein n=1 Tax=Glycomyces sp. MUSA5-2 TaxID=2053002 RepID=UPI0030082D62
MTRNLTFIRGLAVAGAAGLLLTGCGGNEPPVPGENGTNNPDGGGDSSGSSSYGVMAEWDGCEALDDVQAVQDFMGVTDWGTNGIMSSDIPGGLDGEAFNCGGAANLAVYLMENEVTGDKEIPGTANIDVGVAPWESDSEAAENFQERVDQLKEAIETGGTEYSNVQEGEIEGDWDGSYYYAGASNTGFNADAIAYKGDLVLYVFIDYTTDPAVQDGADPVYPFTDESIVDWMLNDYMPTTYSDLLAKKESGL